MFPKTVKCGYSRYTYGKSKHHVVSSVIAIEHIPWDFTYKSKAKEREEVPHAVTAMREALGNEKSEDREGNAPETAHCLIKRSPVLHKEVGTMIDEH